MKILPTKKDRETAIAKYGEVPNWKGYLILSLPAFLFSCVWGIILWAGGTLLGPGWIILIVLIFSFIVVPLIVMIISGIFWYSSILYEKVFGIHD